MPKYANRDHYLDPETGALKNKLGLREESALAEREADYAAARSFELFESPLPGRFDLEHLKALHRRLFSDLYEWAGEIRDIDIAKGDCFFAHHSHIETAAKHVFKKLAEERHLAGLDSAAFSERAAYYLGEINALHPFREVNDRAQREFINHLAYENGFFIEWGSISQAAMVQASIESFHHSDNTRFAALILNNLRTAPRNEND